MGITALAALTILGAVMAAAGPEVVPASGRGDDPGWLGGAFGNGLGVDGGDYIQLERAALLAYALVVACAAAIPRRLLCGAIVALVGLFAVAPPLLSLDVFSYVSYARLEALHGLNPYEVAPEAVPGDESLAFVEDWRGSVSVYGPLFTILTLPLAHLGVAGAVYALKAIAGLAVLATAWLAARLAAARGIDPRGAAALVALNPLTLVHVVGGAHNDGLMAALMTAGVAAVLLGRELQGGVALLAAGAIKASALLVAPFAAIGEDRRRRLLVGMAAGAALVLAIGIPFFGSGIGEALEVVGQNQGITSRASVPGTLARELGLDLDATRIVCLSLFGLLLAGLLVWTARGADWVRAAGWAFLGLLLATSYLTPWYVIWALPLAAVSRDRSLIAATVLVSAFLLRYQVPGLGG